MITPAALILAAAVETGLDRIAAGEDQALRGQRLGLLCHAASTTAGGRHAIEVLRGRGLDLRRIFAPEHGLRGLAAAGEEVRDGLDPASGLPVVSLYGAATRPSPESLRGLDVLVVDLQDVGVRFYTYASTMLQAMEAARDAGLKVVVLDRPNPQGGERLEGPVSDPPEVVPRTLLNRTPGPLVHGLTLGELARMAAAGSPAEKTLTVVALRGWRRAMTWGETGLPWVPPSPNLRSAEAALAYPGTCLLEATNLSEGRGTEEPFLLFGAPWLDVPSVLRGLEAPATRLGFALRPRDFVPRRDRAAPSSTHEGQTCRGMRVTVIRPEEARPYALGVELLFHLRGQPGFAWRNGGEALDRLVGSRGLRQRLEKGTAPPEILAADGAGIAAFRQRRAPFLLYD